MKPIITLTLLLSLTGCFADQQQARAREAQRLHMEALADQLPPITIKQAEAQVRQMLPDPQSALFTDVQPYDRVYRDCSHHREICGNVNFKGPGGGYVGTRGFVVSQDYSVMFTDCNFYAADMPVCK